MGLFGMLCAGFSFLGCFLFCKACCGTQYENNENNENNEHNRQCPDDWRPLIVNEIIVNNPNECFNERVNDSNEPNKHIVNELSDKPPNYDSVMNSLPNDDVFY